MLAYGQNVVAEGIRERPLRPVSRGKRKCKFRPTSSAGVAEGESPRSQATRSASSLGSVRMSTCPSGRLEVHFTSLHVGSLIAFDCPKLHSN